MKTFKRYINRIRKFVDGISEYSLILLRSITPFIAAQLLYYLAEFVDELKISPSFAIHHYSQIFSYIFFSLLSLIGGAFMIDIYTKRNCSADQ